jgi:hypothetical protein
MEIVSKPILAMVYGADRVYLDWLEYSCGTVYSSEAAAEGGIVRRINGSKPVIITVGGHFQVGEIMFFTDMIKKLSAGKGRVVIDGWSDDNFAMIEGKAGYEDGKFLGTFTLKLGVID